MKNRQVLIIDDDRDVIKYLSYVISYLGLTVITAETARGAYAQFKKHCPSVVLVDYKLPDIDAEKLIYKIKELSPITQVIVITGYDNTEIREKSIKAGTSFYLKKPIKKNMLINIVKKAYSLYYSTFLTLGQVKVMALVSRKKTERNIKKNLSGKPINLFIYNEPIEAITRLEEGDIDIIMLDMFFQHNCKIDLIKKIMHQIPFEIAIILLLYDNKSDQTVRAIEAGAVDYIIQSSDMEEMSKSIDDAVNKVSKKRGFNI